MSEAKTNGGRLRHSSDSEPGYTRKSHGRYWQYFDEDGKRVTDRDEIDRLNSIALPPAYTDAWFCKDANGHIQATGKDARGRKQYRYHPAFRARRDKKKYEGTRSLALLFPDQAQGRGRPQDARLEPRCRDRGGRSPARLGP